MGGLIPVRWGDPEEVQIYALIPPAGAEPVQVRLKGAYKGYAVYAGDISSLLGLDTLAGPAFGHQVRGEYVGLFRHRAALVLAGDEGQFLLVEAREVEEISVCIEGVELVAGLAHR